MSSISYASAAMGKEEIDTLDNEQHVTPVEQNTESEPVVEEQAPIEESADTSVEDSPEVESSTPAEPAKKPIKKTLTPAPIPSQSAWGANASPNYNIDEQKWPIPNKDETKELKSQKFIKPITNKWVPIPAKVILPNVRSQKTRRKKKNHDEEKVNGNGSVSGNAAGKKKEKKEELEKEEKKEEKDEKDEVEKDDKELPVEQEQPEKVQDQSAPEQQQTNGFYNQYNNNTNNFQPYRQYRNNNYRSNSQSQPRNFRNQQNYRNNQQMMHPNYQQFQQQQFQFNQHQQFQFQQQQQFHPQYHSQYQLHMQQQQIPPPISPKQNPQEALIQQIDYYFSLENLIKDIYLRQKMNSEGWINLSVILEFKRVKIIINSILNNHGGDLNTIATTCIQNCQNVSINLLNDKTWDNVLIEDIDLRVKDNYDQWLLPQDN